MARDGYLPRIFAGSEGKPPVFSIVLQGAVATCVIYVQSLEKMIKNVSTLLLIFSSLTVAGVYRLYFSAAMREKYGVVPSLVSLGAAALFMVFSAGWSTRSSTIN